jgi:hypothetical protein
MDWMAGRSVQDRAKMAAKGDDGTERNTASIRLWEEGNSLADNIRILGLERTKPVNS